MTRNRIVILSAILGALVVLLASTWFFAMRSEARKPKNDNPRGRELLETTSELNLPLPAYRIANLEQQEIPTDELRRGRVLLVYLTTSCEPCLKEVEIISRLYPDAPPDLRIYGISFERPAQVAAFVKEFDLKFPVLIDMSAQLARSLEVHYFPSKYLVEEGIITTAWHGLTRDEAHLRQQLNIR